MNIEKSNFYNQVIKEQSFSLGDIFFFENIVFTQINEGMHFNYENALEMIKSIYNFYGEEKKFAFVSNRINNYSIEVLDSPKRAELFPNLVIYGIIPYSTSDKINIKLEKQFSEKPVLEFNSIEEAFIYANANLIETLEK